MKPNDEHDELEFWLSPDSSASAATHKSKNKDSAAESADVKHSRSHHESTDDDKPVVSVCTEVKSSELR